MFRSIWEDIKREFSYGNMVTRLVIINAGVFVVINLIWVILQISNGYTSSPLYREILSLFAMSSNWLDVLVYPWSIITSMFLHEGFFHILFNMLMLYWFGRVIGDLVGDHRILPLYLLAGLAGNLTYFIYANWIHPSPGIAYGASGAVMGIVIAAAVLAPDKEMRLILLGDVKLKYIAVALLLIDVIGIGGLDNTGGHFAHLGGAAFGWFFIRRLQQGDDLSAPVNNFIHKVREFFRGLGQDRSKKKERGGPRVAYRNPNNKKEQATRSNRFTRRKTEKKTGGTPGNGLSHEEKVDAILEKIKESGYEKLTEEEKKYLFNASKK